MRPHVTMLSPPVAIAEQRPSGGRIEVVDAVTQAAAECLCGQATASGAPVSFLTMTVLKACWQLTGTPCGARADSRHRVASGVGLLRGEVPRWKAIVPRHAPSATLAGRHPETAAGSFVTLPLSISTSLTNAAAPVNRAPGRIGDPPTRLVFSQPREMR